MEEPRQDLRQFKLNLPTVTERVAQHAQYKARPADGTDRLVPADGVNFCRLS